MRQEGNDGSPLKCSRTQAAPPPANQEVPALRSYTATSAAAAAAAAACLLAAAAAAAAAAAKFLLLSATVSSSCDDCHSGGVRSIQNGEGSMIRSRE